MRRALGLLSQDDLAVRRYGDMPAIRRITDGGRPRQSTRAG